MGTNIIVSSYGKYTGKSTTALNIGLCFYILGKQVKLVSLGGREQAYKAIESSNFKNPSFIYSRHKPNSSDQAFFTVYDVPKECITALEQNLLEKSDLIIPIPAEYYGLAEAKKSITFFNSFNFKSIHILPVMVRQDTVSLKVLEELKIRLKGTVLKSYIPRNFYLAKQFDYDEFLLDKFAEKASVTYLNTALELQEIDFD